MKAKAKILLIVMVSFFCLMPAISAATSYFPEELTGAKAGTSVYLFHSGTAEIKDAAATGDILTVYREDPCRTVLEAGKIRIVSFGGDNYIRAEVVDGNIRPGDMARKGSVLYLVTPAAFICK